MRSTITFDKDVAALLKKELARQNHSLKQVVNDALRRALAANAPAPKKRSKKAPGTVVALTEALELGAGVD